MEKNINPKDRKYIAMIYSITDKQVFVVDALREGAEIVAKYTNIYGPGFNLTYKALKYKMEHKNSITWLIHHSTILSLLKKKVINKKYNLTKRFSH